MDEELRKDVEFLAEVLKEFVQKHNVRYVTATFIDGMVMVSNTEDDTPQINYFKRIQDIG